MTNELTPDAWRLWKGLCVSRLLAPVGTVYGNVVNVHGVFAYGVCRCDYYYRVGRCETHPYE